MSKQPAPLGAKGRAVIGIIGLLLWSIVIFCGLPALFGETGAWIAIALWIPLIAVAIKVGENAGEHL